MGKAAIRAPGGLLNPRNWLKAEAQASRFAADEGVLQPSGAARHYASDETDEPAKNEAALDPDAPAKPTLDPAVIVQALKTGMVPAEFAALLTADGLFVEGRGFRTTGLLDISYLETERCLILNNCDLGEYVHATEAKLGALNLIECTFTHLWARHAVISRRLILDGSAFEELWAPGATIKRGVRFVNATIDQKDKSRVIIDLSGATITGPVYGMGSHCKGSINMDGAQIMDDLDLSTGTFEQEKYIALGCDKVDVRGNVSLQGATLKGHANFEGASIGGAFLAQRLTAIDLDDAALNISRTKIGSVVDFTGAHITGPVNFYNATMQSFSCPNAAFGKSKADAEDSGGLDFEGARFADYVALQWLGGFDGTLNFTNAQTRIFADDGSGWPKPGLLMIDKFRYDSLWPSAEETLSGEAKKGFSRRHPPRLAWLKLQPQEHWRRMSKPQPWRQMVNTLRDMNKSDDARAIAKFARARFRGRGDISRFEKMAYWLEAYPLTISAAILIYMLVCVGVFQAAYDTGYITPVVHESVNGQDTPDTDFSALLYTADVFVPVVDFGQRRNWGPRMGAHASRPPRTTICARDPASLTCLGEVALGAITRVPGGLMYFQAVATVFSWFLLTLLLAFLGGWAQSIFRPREDAAL